MTTTQARRRRAQHRQTWTERTGRPNDPLVKDVLALCDEVDELREATDRDGDNVPSAWFEETPENLRMLAEEEASLAAAESAYEERVREVSIPPMKGAERFVFHGPYIVGVRPDEPADDERWIDYANALRESPNGKWLTLPGPVDLAPSFARACVAVEDRHTAALRAEVTRLRAAIAVLDEVAYAQIALEHMLTIQMTGPNRARVPGHWRAEVEERVRPYREHLLAALRGPEPAEAVSPS